MKVGVIGDSLSVGYMRNNARVLPYSWVKQIGKDSGNQWLNFGASGYTTLLWCSSQTYGKIQMETPGNKCQVYIIGLGVNDCAGTHPIPLGSQNDIVNTPESDATTFYGGYARIIQLIKRLNPNAIIICLTIPKLGDNFNSYNNAIRYITDTYYATDNNVLLLDIANDNMELFNDSSSKLKIDSQKTNAGVHFTAYGYRMIATFMEKKLNGLIYNNSAFENIPFIEYDDTAPVGDV
jgi:lysophospholipase L1-like esterase